MFMKCCLPHQKKRAMLLSVICFSMFIGDMYAVPTSRQRLLIDQDWKFSQTDTLDAVKPGFNDSKWRTLNLPHDWSIEGEFREDAATTGQGGYLPTGIGWYRKHFILPKSAAGKSVWIEFDGVYQNSDVWINGRHLGHYPNGYMSFYYDLTPYLQSRENMIAVRVDNSLQPNTRWYSGSGIYRHVWLNIASPLHVAQWGTCITTPAIDSASATVSVTTKINNNNNSVVKKAVLRTEILNAIGLIVASTSSPIAVTGKGNLEIKQNITVPLPNLWSIENPFMYTAISQIIDNGKTIDETSSSFGVRSIHYDVDKGFYLNGKHVKLNGVCLHHDGGSVGSAVPVAIWARRLQLLKDMGCNAIRTSHNPMAPEFLDLCDRMGFLVQDEVFDEWKTGKVKYGYNQYFTNWAQHDLVNFIYRDRNHPAVVMWSAGNEIREQKSANGYEMLKNLIDIFHKEDLTRPVTTGNDLIAADDGKATLAYLNALDIVGYNYVDRWHERRELFYDIDRHDHPAWKMVGTESVSISGIRGNYYSGARDGDSSGIRPADMPRVIRAEQLWKFVALHDYVIGDFMWTGIDYLGEARWPNKNASSGVMDLCGFPKDAYYFYQSQWTERPMVHLFPHWNWKGKEGKVIQVMAYTNCDSVELFLNGKSFGIKSVEFPRQGNSVGWNRYAVSQVNATTGDLHIMWDVPYEAGTLKAVGRKDGKTVIAEIQTTGTPAAIRLTVDRKEIHADLSDVVHVKVEVVDENGLTVPDANNLIQLQVEGAGNVIGFDNGNPGDHTNMKSKQRNTFNGLALAVIQASAPEGTIRVTSTSPGLKEAMVAITIRK